MGLARGFDWVGWRLGVKRIERVEPPMRTNFNADATRYGF
jgi:hypothetical protein